MTTATTRPASIPPATPSPVATIPEHHRRSAELVISAREIVLQTVSGHVLDRMTTEDGTDVFGALEAFYWHHSGPVLPQGARVTLVTGDPELRRLVDTLGGPHHAAARRTSSADDVRRWHQALLVLNRFLRWDAQIAIGW